MIRIGHGYDVHRLAENRRFVIGGVNIPYERGLLGHSDADVLVHAVMDAMLGALAMGDIGKHFPDCNSEYKDADSIILLERVYEMISAKGWRIGNIDSTIICQQPRLAPYIEEMRFKLASACRCEVEQVSVKATTEEKLGFTGSGEGIAAHAVCLLEK